MRGKLVLLVVLFSAVFVDSCLSLTTEEVVRRVQGKYEKIWSLTADFTQESTSKMLNQTRITKASGKVYFRKPGQIRWQYATAPKHVWISDGETLWIYQPEENQVFVGKVDRDAGRFYLAFLVGQGDLRKDFEISGWDQEVEESDLGYRIRLTPKKPQATMDRIVLTIDRERGYVTQAEIYDAYGNLTRTHFRRIHVNRKLPSDLFTFVIPPGTEVVENLGQ